MSREGPRDVVTDTNADTDTDEVTCGLEGRLPPGSLRDRAWLSFLDDGSRLGEIRCMREYWLGGTVIGFDGTVLEVFGCTYVTRHHIYQLRGLLLGQARSGKWRLAVDGPGQGTPYLELDSEHDVAGARALIEAVNEARTARGWPPVPTS
ncbi:MAG: hypothetical protein HYY06_14765 [Deltaproteobacteria bacterium]|nr:hypothetical protein [Deltaproteobacteria bacterium]